MEEIKPMLLEWKRTKSIALACDICDLLLEKIDEAADDEAAGCTVRYTDADGSES